MQVTIIYVDSCYWVSRANGGKGLIRAQAEAISFYCKEKLKVGNFNFCIMIIIICIYSFMHSLIRTLLLLLQIHPLNTVCLAAMGGRPCFSEPTRDLEESRLPWNVLIYKSILTALCMISMINFNSLILYILLLLRFVIHRYDAYTHSSGYALF